jgi:putative ABC transport system permease protein
MPSLITRCASAVRLALGFRGADVEAREMSEEIQFHIDMHTAKLRERGMSEADARRAATVAFGGASRWADEARDEYRSRPLEELARDVRYAIRSLRRAPTFVVAVTLSLALGIGATSALYTVVERVLLRPLPYGTSGTTGELVMLWRNYRAKPAEPNVVSYADFHDWVTQNRDIAGAAVFNIWTPTLTEGEPEPLIGSRVSADFFRVLGVPPMLGRGFRADEDVPGGPPVAVIAYSLWKRRFHSDSSIVGKTIGVNGVRYTVVGVMPPGFRDPEPLWKHGAELWRPLDLTLETNARAAHYLRAIARLQPQVSVEHAQRDLAVIGARLEREYPETNAEQGVLVVPMQEQVVGGSAPVLYAAFAGALCLLLIVCANVASLVLSRYAARAPTLAVHATLGASRPRVTRMLLLESFVLATVGCIVGLGIATAALAALRGIAPTDLPRVEEIHLDGRAVAVTVLLSIASALVFGLVPAARAARVNLATVLQDAGARSTRQGMMRRAIVVAQFAFSLVLLVSAGLLVKSIARLDSVPLGLTPDDLLTFQVSLPAARYTSDDATRMYFAALLDRLRTTPGITGAATTSALPMTGVNDLTNLIRGPVERPVAGGISMHMRAVSPEYFGMLRVPLEGRDFTVLDDDKHDPVVILNRVAARALFPTENPIGRQVYLSEGHTMPATIVGIAGDVRYDGPIKPPGPELFQPAAQYPWSVYSVVVRGRGTAQSLLPLVKAAMHGVDPGIPTSDVRPMRAIARAYSSRQRFYAAVFGMFAGAALLLSSIGIYGVIAYAVTQRRREIAIRMALGAQRSTVVTRIVGSGFVLVLIGIALGSSAAVTLARAIKSLLFGVAPADVTTIVASALVLGGIGVIAALVPALRASRLSPIAMLRSE